MKVVDVLSTKVYSDGQQIIAQVIYDSLCILYVWIDILSLQLQYDIDKQSKDKQIGLCCRVT